MKPPRTIQNVPVSHWPQFAASAPGLMCACLALLLWFAGGSALRAADILGGLIRFETASDSLSGPPTAPSAYGFGSGDTSWAQPPADDRILPPDYHGPDFFFHHSDPDAEWRHRGRGNPLQGTSWLNRPLHAGWFVGGFVGDELIGGRVDQTEDLFGGYRIGWDWDHYWGSEVRLAFARPDLADALSDEQPRISRNWFVDAHVAYYPWGDAQWRPYVSAGMGLATFRFLDEELVEHENTLFQLPLGAGVKYQGDRWWALRMDVTDNIAFGSAGLDTMHNFTYTFGIDAHFGPQSHRKYFPY